MPQRLPFEAGQLGCHLLGYGTPHNAARLMPLNEPEGVGRLSDSSDPEVERLVAILSKDEDERTDADWEALGAADESTVNEAVNALGLTVED